MSFCNTPANIRYCLKQGHTAGAYSRGLQKEPTAGAYSRSLHAGAYSKSLQQESTAGLTIGDYSRAYSRTKQ